jgi:hypothetical protein
MSACLAPLFGLTFVPSQLAIRFSCAHLVLDDYDRRLASGMRFHPDIRTPNGAISKAFLTVPILWIDRSAGIRPSQKIGDTRRARSRIPIADGTHERQDRGVAETMGLAWIEQVRNRLRMQRFVIRASE